MAWYDGTFSCGHEGRVNIIGPSKDRQRKADYRFSGVCEECYKKQLEEKREQANQQALETSKEMELPELQGTEKQVAWANTLRLTMIEDLNKEIFNTTVDEAKAVLEAFGCKTRRELRTAIQEWPLIVDDFMQKETKASFFIDNRNFDIKLIVKMIKDYYIAKEEVIESIPSVSETIVAAKETTHVGVATITVKTDMVEVEYVKDDDFISIVKGLGYKWNGVAWTKDIKPRMISSADRAAELGNKLLNAGFTINIQDDVIRQNAVNGEYEKEHDRWITLLEDGRIGIWWLERDDRLYKNARKIKSSKWESRWVKVDIAYYEEVLDFADAYGFGINKTVHKAIEVYKEQLENINKVEVAVVEEDDEVNKLNDILSSSADILGDLLDED